MLMESQIRKAYSYIYTALSVIFFIPEVYFSLQIQLLQPSKRLWLQEQFLPESLPLFLFLLAKMLPRNKIQSMSRGCKSKKDICLIIYVTTLRKFLITSNSFCLSIITNLPEVRKILFFVEMKTRKRLWTYSASSPFVSLFLRMIRVPNLRCNIVLILTSPYPPMKAAFD